LESREQKPILSQNSPVLKDYGGGPLKAAIEGLYSETCGMNSPSILGYWVDLAHQYALRFAQPHDYDDRLWRLWNHVEPDLNRKWNLCELAEIAHVSEEHLRRLCRKKVKCCIGLLPYLLRHRRLRCSSLTWAISANSHKFHFRFKSGSTWFQSLHKRSS
jgi:AraC-like DNA-binding protein